MSTVERDLPDNATHEEIVAFVEQTIAADAEASESDSAEGKAGDTTSKETPVDEDSSVDGDATADSGEDQGQQDSDSREWIDDALKAEVAAMGISDEELSEFSSREELDRAMRLFDRAAMTAGRESGESKGSVGKEASNDRQAGTQSRGPDGKSSKEDTEGSSEESGYKISLDPETYDEGVISEFKAMRGYYDARLKAVEEQFAQFTAIEQQRTAEAFQERFDSIVDTLGHADLFGESGKETKAQLENRRKLFDEHQVYLTGLKTLGREGRLDKVSVDRVLRMAFADHLSKQQQKNLTRKISRQSSMRMGGSVSKPTDHKYSGPPENDPELLALYDELEEKSGR